MAADREARPRSLDPPSASRPAPRRRRGFMPSSRLAGVLLLIVWVGPVTFVQSDAPRLLQWIGAPGRAAAWPRVIAAGEALVLEPCTPLELRLRDGSVVRGRFLGRALLEDSLYARRFAARSRTSSYAPFALGETLRVSLRDGREWTLPFAGYGELVLLLHRPDGAGPLRVPFEFLSEIRGSNGERVEPRTLARAFRAGRLPSAEAIVIEDMLPLGSDADRWSAALRVAVEDVHATIVTLPSGDSVAGAVALGAVVGVVLFIVFLASAARSSSHGCTGPQSLPPILSSLPLTTRPFDLDRGCYVGEELIVESWPTPDSDAPARALAGPAPSGVPAG